jgi:hypothetical protein
MMTFKDYIENLWGDIPWAGRKPSDGQPDSSGPNPNHGGSGGNSGGAGGAMGGGGMGGAGPTAPPSGGSPADPLSKSPMMMKKLMKKKMRK